MTTSRMIAFMHFFGIPLGRLLSQLYGIFFFTF